VFLFGKFLSPPANHKSPPLSVGRVGFRIFVVLPTSSPMHDWHAIAVRAKRPDAVQQWAKLEAKSALMREELAWRYAPRKYERQRPLANAIVACEFIAVALKTWWQIYGS
jgi:hypothetical protein